MAENDAAAANELTAATESTTAVAEQEQPFQYQITVEDAGPATKKVTVEIPPDRITSKLAEQFKELRQQAAIPGFRPGHAPQKLIEKRFARDVKEQVRRTLISESYEQAVKQNGLEVLGEPQFDNPEAIDLPQSGPLNYSFQVEVQPNIMLPPLTGLKIKRPKIEIKEENVDQAMSNLREQQGALIPVEDRGAEEKDYLIADVQIKVDGNVVAQQNDAQMIVRPARIAGLEVADFVEQVKGMKAGETRTLTVKIADTYANETLRGKDAQIEITLKDIKRLELAEITPEFLDDLGFNNAQELRDALKEQMVERITYDVQQAMRMQISQYLMTNVPMDLPTQLSARQTERVVQRRSMDLLMRGMSREQVEANVEQLGSGAQDEAVRELKAYFILQKVANDQNVEVDEAELNGRIAMLAAQRGQRPEKLKQEMSKDGTLMNLYIQMREHKALDKILETADIEEVDVEKTPEKPAE